MDSLFSTGYWSLLVLCQHFSITTRIHCFCWRRRVVSRVDSEERTIQFLKQSTGSVSKAVWPSSIRRHVATGKGRHRMMVLRRLLMLYKVPKIYLLYKFDKTRYLCKSLLARCSCTIHVVIIVLASDVVQMLCILYRRPTLLVVTDICTATILIVIHLVSNNMEKYQEYVFLFKNKFKVMGLKREKRCLIESRLVDCPQASLPPSTKGEDEEIEQESVVISFPGTPMPTTPLIRVMETINLSSTKIEHFSALQDLSVVKSAREGYDRHIDMSPQE